MAVQQELEAVYENAEDALRAAVQQLGGSKAVGHRLWPAKPIHEAQRDLLDALNQERARKLEISEVIQILRWACEAGFHSAKHFFDIESGYQRTEPLKPADELAEAQRAFAEAIQTVKDIADRIERLTQPGLQQIRGGKS